MIGKEIVLMSATLVRILIPHFHEKPHELCYKMPTVQKLVAQWFEYIWCFETIAQICSDIEIQSEDQIQL